jgi:hypothetical protein
MYKTQYNNF